MHTERDKDRKYWERHAQKYDVSTRALGRPIPRMLELTSAAAAGAERVLELAAGTGLVTPVLARAAKEVIATDYAASMVTLLEGRVRDAGLTNVRCEQADIYALRFEDSSFDMVVAANVLHLVPDLSAALSSMRRVLKPQGRLVLPTYCHDETASSWVISRILAVTGFPGYRRFTVVSLEQALVSAGLRLDRVERLPGLIPIGFIEGRFAN